MTTQSEMQAALKSPAVKDALKTALADGLKSPAVKEALREAVQAELEEGFANHAPNLSSAAERKKVSPNQQWLFDAVEGLIEPIKDIVDTVHRIEEKA